MDASSADNKPDYLNPDMPVKRRTEDILSRMSLEEKVAQMVCVWNDAPKTLIDENGDFDFQKAKISFKHGLGQVARPGTHFDGKTPGQTAELTNTIQKFFVENSRLGIPVVFHAECLHGLAAREATCFSQPIGLAATFDPELLFRLYAMTAKEARLCGVHQALTPVVDVAREPRWGRVEETYGEDPYLVSRMGVAAVKGFQGDATFADKKHVIATLKHFAAHSEPESGTNCAPVNVSCRILREVFLYPFKKAIQQAGAISVMASYNEIDSVPSHANKWLLGDILRREWEFEGYVVSDYYAIRELNEREGFFGQHLAENGKQAAKLALNAGVNIELPEPDCYPNLVELAKEGCISESAIDQMVQPMLEWKFKLGLFEDPYVCPETAKKTVGCETHAKLALEAACKTITLLKNEDDTAPIDVSKVKTIAVIGPNADREMLGGYSGVPKHCSTVLEGIQEYVGDSVKLLYHEGCKITVGGSWEEDEVVLSNPEDDRKSIAEAVKVAEQADVVVLAVGGNEQTSREAYEVNHMGDRTNLQMVGLQDELVNAIADTGKPIIALLFNGRPLVIHNLKEKAHAIFECWYLGQETGKAVAQVLFGQVNPGGKLPITIPRSVGHIPAYYNYKPSARRGYLFDDVKPLYAFGFGLSYTQFEMSGLRLEKDTIKTDGSTRVLIDVTNTGKVTGDEVVQMYIRDCISSVTRPVKELKGFERITLDPGQTKTVILDITPEHLSFYDINMNDVVEPGEFKIMAGNSSRDQDLQTVRLFVEP
ncbi:MAG: glycoside hydrolase family 3 C-terminal domain-containing protein [Planctomycetes bacterium]|nr:glycoside hydrolase family 3 C-terminal domain-containing protein [Planctomycetota bacterium]